MKCGSLNPTKVPLDGSCRAFGNQDGYLFCDKEMENDENIPKGYYENDCGGCSFDESTHMLTCKRCRKNNGEFAESSVEVKENCVVTLNDGVLVCREDAKAFVDNKNTIIRDAPKVAEKDAKEEL